MHNAMVEQPLPAEQPLPDLIKVDGRDRHPLHRAALFTGAIVFFVLGVVGWLLPVITGVPFYVVAILLLGMASTRAANWFNAQERRLPHRWRVRLRKMLLRGKETGTGDGQ
jgi:hypothetical protein